MKIDEDEAHSAIAAGAYEAIRYIIEKEATFPFEEILHAIKRGIEDATQNQVGEQIERLIQSIESLAAEIDGLSCEIYKKRMDEKEK